MGGYGQYRSRETIRPSGVFVGRYLGMLQWRPKLIALVAVIVLVAAVSGQFTWDSYSQLTWF
jgi:uncharacterized protein involved in exopolysaccharide biosynthesis